MQASKQTAAAGVRVTEKEKKKPRTDISKKTGPKAKKTPSGSGRKAAKVAESPDSPATLMMHAIYRTALAAEAKKAKKAK